ncbi:MAG TPA: ATP synthase F1 subunit delta [Thermoanaerobaculia bacterium]|nr:ATP synthase F1 subunit delta [Thermoanaerobaculia bacterium]
MTPDPKSAPPVVDERDLALGRVYATSMLELAEAEGQSDELLEELGELAAYLDHNPDFAAFLANPVIDERVRREVLEKLFRGQASDLLVDALQVINHKGRLGKLRAIAAAFRAELRARRGLVDARVTVAVPLTAEQRASLNAAVARFTGKQPELFERVDPSILGGCVVEVEGRKIDSSVAARLRAVAAALTGRAEREIAGGVSAE